VIPSLGPAQTQLSFGRVSLSGFSEAAADRKGWGPGKFGGREGGVLSGPPVADCTMMVGALVVPILSKLTDPPALESGHWITLHWSFNPRCAC
jgi:hypothetical protein